MRKPWKYGMLGALIVIAVLYGIELTSQGLADVYGPLDGGTAPSVRQEVPDVRPEQTAAPAQQPITEIGGSGGQTPPGPLAEEGTQAGVLSTVPPVSGESSVNRLADGTAGLLQSVTSGGIRFVVSVFEAITD